MRRRVPCVLLALGVWLLVATGCSSRATHLYLDPTFTPDALGQGGLVVLGVVSLAGEDDLSTRTVHSELVRRVLHERRTDLRVLPPGDAWVAMGLQSSRRILDRYRLTGRLLPADVDTVGFARRVARYGLLGRIDLDATYLDHERREEEIGGRLRYEIEPIAKREVGVTFDVVDLSDGRIVWSVYLRRVDSIRGDRITYEPLEGDVLTEAEWIRVVRELLEKNRGPEPPTTASVLENLTRDLARKFPGAKG